LELRRRLGEADREARQAEAARDEVDLVGGERYLDPLSRRVWKPTAYGWEWEDELLRRAPRYRCPATGRFWRDLGGCQWAWEEEHLK
jgi:hypothetical protein